MTQLSLEQIASQLKSPLARDRMLALAELQKESMSAEAAFPLIREALTDSNIKVRSMAVFALGVKPTAENLALLLPILASDEDYNIRAMAAGALGYLEDRRALEPLRRAFYEDTNWLVQFSAAVSLGNLKDIAAKSVLLEALKSEHVILQQAAVMALAEIGAIDAVDQILQFADAEDWLLRQRLAEALGSLPCEKSLSALRFLQKDSHAQVAQAARLSLERCDRNLKEKVINEESLEIS
jgi:HEAT repeat protein